MAEAWSEVLSGVIPEQQLESAYLRAIQDKADNFPLTANDMVAGYRANCSSDKAAPRLAQDANLLDGEVCKKCFGSGLEQYVENGYKQVRRCDHIVAEDPDDVSMF